MSTIAITETYLDVERLITDTANKFRLSHGGELEELISEARLLFMLAYESFDVNKASFPTWVRFKIWHGLATTARTMAKANARCPRVEIKLEEVHTPEHWDLGAWLAELGDDARFVASLAVRPPLPVRLSAAGQRGGIHKPETHRSAIVEHLHDLGWCMSRIMDSFNEVREALS